MDLIRATDLTFSLLPVDGVCATLLTLLATGRQFRVFSRKPMFFFFGILEKEKHF
jgi:hypothetical protein